MKEQEAMRHRLRCIAVGVCAAVALAAVLASSASAGLRITAALGCQFYVGGTFTATGLLSPGVDAPTLAAMPALAGTAALGLTVTRVVTNSLCPGVALNDLVRLAGTWTPSPAPMVTLA